VNKELLTSLPKLVIPAFILLLCSCSDGEDHSSNKVSIVFADGRATGLVISKKILQNIPSDSIPSQCQIRLAGHGVQPAMGGNYIVKKDEVIFEPLIPFTKGLEYDILLRGQRIETILIPKTTGSPKLLDIYPSADTLPANLLKIYIVFSHPMVQAHSLQWVKLMDEKGYSMPNIFLALPSELWNPDRTMLTLWLDPGRIKRGLQPNKQLGPPLISGNKYKLVISDKWPDEDGNDLVQTYIKDIVTTEPDTSIPSLNKWKLIIPKSGTVIPLEVDFDKSLDRELILNAIRIVDDTGNIIPGSMQVGKGETKLYFIPAGPWKKSNYKLLAEGRLADLAGNNLNRLFDVDLKNIKDAHPDKKVFEKEWQVE
jgi:hypothetical protein